MDQGSGGSWESKWRSRALMSMESMDLLECVVGSASMKGRLGSCILISGAGRRSYATWWRSGRVRRNVRQRICDLYHWWISIDDRNGGVVSGCVMLRLSKGRLGRVWSY